MKWNKWGSTPHLYTYRLNWVRRTWGWWDEWGVTALQTQDSKLSPVGLRPSTLTLVHWGCPQYSIFTIEQGGKFLFLWNLNARAGDESATFLAGTRTPPLPPPFGIVMTYIQTHYLWIYYWFTVRGAAQHFSYFILHNILNVHNIYWSCHCYPLPVIIDTYVFTLVLQ